MSDLLASALFQVWALSFFLILVRVAAFVAFVPVIGGRNLPRMVKIGLSVSLAAMWLGSYGPAPLASLAGGPSPIHPLGLALATGREILFGAMLGYAFGLFVLPARLAGSYIAQEMGLTLATLTDPASQTSVNILGQLFEVIGVLIFFSLDIHHSMLNTLHVTFQRWPIGGSFKDLPILEMSGAVADAHQWGLLIAAPLAICLFITLIVLTLMMRAAPQLNLLSIGLTVRLVVGLGATLIFLPEMIDVMSRVVRQSSGMIYWLGST